MQTTSHLLILYKFLSKPMKMSHQLMTMMYVNRNCVWYILDCIPLVLFATTIKYLYVCIAARLCNDEMIVENVALHLLIASMRLNKLNYLLWHYSQCFRCRRCSFSFALSFIRKWYIPFLEGDYNLAENHFISHAIYMRLF